MFPTVFRSLGLFFFPITQWRDKLSSKGLDIKSSEITEIEICTNQKSKPTLISKFTWILSVFKPKPFDFPCASLCLLPYFDLAVRLLALLQKIQKKHSNNFQTKNFSVFAEHCGREKSFDFARILQAWFSPKLMVNWTSLSSFFTPDLPSQTRAFLQGCFFFFLIVGVPSLGSTIILQLLSHFSKFAALDSSWVCRAALNLQWDDSDEHGQWQTIHSQTHQSSWLGEQHWWLQYHINSSYRLLSSSFPSKLQLHK